MSAVPSFSVDRVVFRVDDSCKGCCIFMRPQLKQHTPVAVDVHGIISRLDLSKSDYRQKYLDSMQNLNNRIAVVCGEFEKDVDEVISRLEAKIGVSFEPRDGNIVTLSHINEINDEMTRILDDKSPAVSNRGLNDFC